MATELLRAMNAAKCSVQCGQRMPEAIVAEMAAVKVVAVVNVVLKAVIRAVIREQPLPPTQADNRLTWVFFKAAQFMRRFFMRTLFSLVRRGF